MPEYVQDYKDGHLGALERLIKNYAKKSDYKLLQYVKINYGRMD